VIVRRAGRVVVVDARDRVLLLRGCDPARPDAGSWWLTPGGGVDDGETERDAAQRELREETGLDTRVDGPIVLERVTEFDFDGRHFEQREQFFVVRVDAHEVQATELTEVEERALLGHRWWTHAELAATGDVVYPEQLLALLDEILDAR